MTTGTANHAGDGDCLLIVDANQSARRRLERLLDAALPAYDRHIAATLAEASEVLRLHGPRAILTELNLPDSSGVATIAALHALRPSLPIVVTTDASFGEFGPAAIEAGAEDYLIRSSLDAAALQRAVRLAIARVRSRLRAARVVYQDPLTCLANRTSFERSTFEALVQAGKSGARAVITVIRPDHLDARPNQPVPPIGEPELAEACRRLRDCLRPGDYPARIGTDEFAVLFAASTTPADAAATAQRVRHALAQPYPGPHDEQLPGFTTSAGVASSTGTSRAGAAGRLLHEATEAMRAAAASRAGTLIYASPEYQRVISDLHVAHDLRDALRLDSLEVEYQTMVRVDSGSPVAVEALVRWRHPDRGLLSPSEFLAVAQQHGLLTSVDDWVLSHACRNVRGGEVRRSDNQAGDELQLCVNTASADWQRADYAKVVADVCRQTGFPPQQLFLEIPARDLGTFDADMISRVHQVQDQGVRMVLDGIGSADFPLHALDEVRFDMIKTDRAVIGSGSASVLKMLRAIATSTGAQIVGLGVETDEQAALLAACGVGLGQGFLYSAPGPAGHVRGLASGRR